MTIPISTAELNRRFRVMRPTVTSDDGGGSDVTLVDRGIVRAKVSQPTTQEQYEAQQAGSSFTVVAHLKPDADVRRGDHLIALDDGDSLRVKSTVTPSEPVYLRADAEQIQVEGGAP
jgi:SPP1 family predicted phage head-tail adaptor